VRAQGESVVAAADGRELKARFVPRERVRFADDGTPLHPEQDDLVLEEVVEKMSKSRGNVVSPDDVIAQFGADTMRLYELFMGPLEKGAPWSTEGIPGCHRFLQRAWRLLVDEDAPGEPARTLAAGRGTEAQARLAARTVDGVTRDLEQIQPNTAIAKLMVFAREIDKDGPVPEQAALEFVKMLSPFAPHLAEELWAKLGRPPSVAWEPWPEAEATLLVEETVRLAVQVNGKRRGEIEVAADADEAGVREAALAAENVQRHLGGKEPRRVIIVPGRLVNIVV
jgi:leucyl-tRNA synthetase